MNLINTFEGFGEMKLVTNPDGTQSIIFVDLMKKEKKPYRCRRCGWEGKDVEKSEYQEDNFFVRCPRCNEIDEGLDVFEDGEWRQFKKPKIDDSLYDGAWRMTDDTIKKMSQYASVEYKCELIEEMKRQFKEQKIKELWDDDKGDEE